MDVVKLIELIHANSLFLEASDMQNNIFMDSGDIYSDRDKEIPKGSPFQMDMRTTQIQVRRMKALGKSFEEIDNELNLDNGKAKELYG